MATTRILFDGNVTARTSARNLNLKFFGSIIFLLRDLSSVVIIGTRLAFVPRHAVLYAYLVLTDMTLQLGTAVMNLSRAAFRIEAEMEVVHRL